MKDTALMVDAINGLCLEGRNLAKKLPFPKGGVVYRGAGFNNEVAQSFYTVGKSFRVPGFLATSFSQEKAIEFAEGAEGPEGPTRKQSILCEYRACALDLRHSMCSNRSAEPDLSVYSSDRQYRAL